MDAPLLFGFRNSLDAMNAGLVFENPISAFSLDAAYYFFITTSGTFRNIDYRYLKTTAIAETLVHSPEVSGKDGSFIAARSCANFENTVFIVIRIFGHQQFLDLRIELITPRTGRLTVHSRIGRGAWRSHLSATVQTAAELPSAAPAHPVFITHRGGHTAYVSSLALQKARLAEDVADPPGGHFDRDVAGRLTGRPSPGVSDRPRRPGPPD